MPRLRSSMSSAVVLGAGLVGSVMAWDLTRDDGWSVTIADVREEALRRVSERTDGRVKTIRADLSRPEEIRRIVEPFDVVLGALGSRIGLL